MRGIFIAGMISAFAGTPALADPYDEIRARRPDLFHPETGYRIGWQRAPTPDDIPLPARIANADEVAALLAAGAVAVDVFGALQSRYDELEGTWLVSGPHKTLPGATWLPETGRGVLDPAIGDYFSENLRRLTNGDPGRSLVIFCTADCWMSWNAARRASALGYNNVYWFRDGIDGWTDSGRDLEEVLPVPVDVE